MIKIIDIITAIQNDRIYITDHADEEAGSDGLKMDEIYFSVVHGEIIEEYVTDHGWPVISQTIATGYHFRLCRR